MAIGSSLIRRGFQAFRSGGLRKGAKFIRSASNRGFKSGFKRFRKFRGEQLKRLSTKNRKRFKNVEGRVTRFTRSARDRTAQGFQSARKTVNRFGRRVLDGQNARF